MTIQHSALAGSDLHEPKGIGSAAAGKVYIADGAGSGAWVAGEIVLNVDIVDVSTQSSAYVVSPVAGTIVAFYTVLHGAITVADANVKLQIADVDVTNGAVVVANSGSAAGVVDSATPTAANTVAAGQAIEVVTDGGSTDAARLTCTIVIRPSA